MPGMVELVAVRHGETVLNAGGLLTGQLDPPLTEKGWEQGRALAGRLDGSFDVVVHSGTVRTAQTLAAAGFDPAAACVDPRFRERSFGTLEGEPVARWRQPQDLGVAPPGGESYVELAVRVMQGLRDLDGRVLLCAHSGVLRVLRAVAGDVPDVEAFLSGGSANGAVVRLAYDNELTMPAVLATPPRS